jgi:hypothetical protein
MQITVKKAIELGLEPALFWNNEQDKLVDIDLFIVASLKRGYSEDIVKKFIKVFGSSEVEVSFKKYSDKIGPELFEFVMNILRKEKNEY